MGRRVKQLDDRAASQSCRSDAMDADDRNSNAICFPYYVLLDILLRLAMCELARCPKRSESWAAGAADAARAFHHNHAQTFRLFTQITPRLRQDPKKEPRFRQKCSGLVKTPFLLVFPGRES